MLCKLRLYSSFVFTNEVFRFCLNVRYESFGYEAFVFRTKSNKCTFLHALSINIRTLWYKTQMGKQEWARETHEHVDVINENVIFCFECTFTDLYKSIKVSYLKPWFRWVYGSSHLILIFCSNPSLQIHAYFLVSDWKAWICSTGNNPFSFIPYCLWRSESRNSTSKTRITRTLISMFSTLLWLKAYVKSSLSVIPIALAKRKRRDQSTLVEHVKLSFLAFSPCCSRTTFTWSVKTRQIKKNCQLSKN